MEWILGGFLITALVGMAKAYQDGRKAGYLEGYQDCQRHTRQKYQL